MTVDPGRRLLSPELMAESLFDDGSSRALATASKVLWEGDLTEIGVWEAGPGSDIDVEADEVFLVLSGTGTLTFHDGSHIELNPGSLVRLHAGDRTTWEVTERLRKLYITPRASSEPSGSGPGV
jgi:uncharacterized cupin superfamily protein